MATVVETITLDEAVRKSNSMKKNTFIWITKEDIFGSVFSDEYSFNSIVVMWVRHTYAYTCYMAVDNVPSSPDASPFMIGTNHNNGYFPDLKTLRQAHPRLFEAKGEFKALQLLW